MTAIGAATAAMTNRSGASSISERSYRLIDYSCKPHHQLDTHYNSVDDAIADAIAWIGDIGESDHPANLIGVEVSSANGDWRTYRLPGQLVCNLSTSYHSHSH